MFTEAYQKGRFILSGGRIETACYGNARIPFVTVATGNSITQNGETRMVTMKQHGDEFRKNDVLLLELANDQQTRDALAVETTFVFDMSPAANKHGKRGVLVNEPHLYPSPFVDKRMRQIFYPRAVKEYDPNRAYGSRFVHLPLKVQDEIMAIKKLYERKRPRVVLHLHTDYDRKKSAYFYAQGRPEILNDPKYRLLIEILHGVFINSPFIPHTGIDDDELKTCIEDGVSFVNQDNGDNTIEEWGQSSDLVDLSITLEAPGLASVRQQRELLIPFTQTFLSYNLN